ncbi:MAG: hypothetical protein K2H23_04280, partial [Oscillospiraceae bacterium]|nr:hypothetical protein [Oscillospiraceae bacterium]
MSEMKIKVRFDFINSKLFAEAKITLDKQVTDFSFILNKNLTVTECICGKNPAQINADSEVQPLFCAESNQICLQSDTPFSVAEIKYSGSINGWLNIISDEIISLNWYSVWFPQMLSEDTAGGTACDRTEIFGCEDYTLIKGEYAPDKNIWHYGGHGFDRFNLILYKKSKVNITESQHVSVFYIDESLKGSAEISKNIYEDILKYYTNDLFKREFTEHIDIACLYPQIKSGGAYKRRGLICCTELGSDESSMIPLNAHELAHEWCSGADSGTWE